MLFFPLKSILLVSILLTSIHHCASGNDFDQVVEAITKAEKQFSDCEYSFYQFSVPGEPSENARDRFGGGLAGFESFKGTGEFALASNRYSFGQYTSSKLEVESTSELEAFRLLFIGNSKYKAILKQVSKTEYQLSERTSVSAGTFSTKDARRDVFAPLLGLDLQQEKSTVEIDTSFDGADAWSITTISNANGQWERRSMYFDPETQRCMGQEYLYSNNDTFTEVHSKSVYRIEYDSKSKLPAKYVQVCSGKHKFTTMCFFTKMTFGKSDKSIYFLNHYGIDDSP